ncbi:MAG: arsenic resistance protein, partial [Candidatus Sigynarchaeota archaeon]
MNQESKETTSLPEKNKGLSKFEKFLVLWIGLCIVLGLAISQILPGIGAVIDSLKIGQVSIPIGICLFLMMYPAVMNLKASELRKLRKNPAPIIVTLMSNWILAPLVGTFLAGALLSGITPAEDARELIVAVILLHASPCTAMVLVWGYLAGGNQEQNVVNTSINTVTIIFLYAPVVVLLTGLQNIVFPNVIVIDWVSLLVSAGVFIGLPIIVGYFSKKYIIERKGETWFNDVYKEKVGKIAMLALLGTLVVLFAMNG